MEEGERDGIEEGEMDSTEEEEEDLLVLDPSHVGLWHYTLGSWCHGNYHCSL